MDDYIKIYQETKNPIVARSTMKDILKKLPESKFIRIHKSYIVSLDKIQTIQSQSLQLNNQTIPIGQTYKSILENYF
jgi:DNA-binding LytR/AlgR family response regulator